MRQQLGRRILVIVTGLLLSVCPRRRRFAVAQRIAKLLRPLVCRTSLFADQIQFFDDFPEVALRIVYRSMMRLNIGFDPALTVHGAEALGAGGMLILTGHFSLNGLFIRWLSDRGYRVSMVMYSPFREPKVTGTRTPLDVIKSDQMVLVRIRRRLAAGGVVIFALDTGRTSPGWRTIDTPRGRRSVSDVIIRFAERAGFPVLFCSTRLTASDEVFTKIVRPTSTRAAIVYDEFCQFLNAEAEQVARQSSNLKPSFKPPDTAVLLPLSERATHSQVSGLTRDQI